MKAVELDYAMLAEYAKVENDKLTVLGASFTQVFVPSLPTLIRFYVSGRFRVPEDVEAFDLDISIHLPGAEASKMEINGEFEVEGHPHVYSDRFGALFSAEVNAPIFESGLVEVFVIVNGETARRLAFDVSLGQV